MFIKILLRPSIHLTIRDRNLKEQLPFAIFLPTLLNNTLTVVQNMNRFIFYPLTDPPPPTGQEVNRIKRTEQRLTSRGSDGGRSFTRVIITSVMSRYGTDSLNHGDTAAIAPRRLSGERGRFLIAGHHSVPHVSPRVGSVEPGQVPGGSGYYIPPQWC